ncbi:MAG: hypothetical protein K6G83_10390 [Lachnospiraceae bacterium]|nr:hypothetical protein [Lachnospiraceae bacterium]
MIRDFFRRQNRIVLVLSVLTVLAASIPLWRAYCINGHDLEYHLLRIEALKEGIQAGRPFLRVNMLFFGGAGYASSLFYPDLLLYFPALLRVLGVPINQSYHIFIGLCILLSYLSAYYCGRRMTGSPWAGLFAGMLTTLCEYFIEDIYVRSAVGEITAFIFLPFVIAGLYNLLEEIPAAGTHRNELYLLGIGYGGLLLCHTGSFILSLIFGFLIVLLHIGKILRTPGLFGRLSLTALLTAAATCFYWLPVMEQLLKGRFYVSTPWMKPVDELRTFAQIFYTDFPSCGGFLIVLYVLRLLVKKKETLISFSDKLFCFGILFSLGTTGLFPWRRLGPYLTFLQFPWRLFLMSSVLFAFADAILLYVICRERYIEAVSCIVFIVCALLAFSVMEKNDQGYYDYGLDYFSYKPFTAHVIAGEWLPDTVKDPDALLRQSEEAVGSDGKPVDYVREKNELTARIDRELSYVDVPFIYYAGYEAVSETGTPLMADGNGVNGMMRIYLPTGYRGAVRAYYAGTPVQLLSVIISLITLLWLCFRMIRTIRGARKGSDMTGKAFLLMLLLSVTIVSPGLSGCGLEENAGGEADRSSLSEIEDTLTRYGSEKSGEPAAGQEKDGEKELTAVIACSQGGFEQNSHKSFILMTEGTIPEETPLLFEVFRPESEKCLFQGELTERSDLKEGAKRFFYGDFSELAQSGEYTIRCFLSEAVQPESPAVMIESGHYQKLLTAQTLEVQDGAETGDPFMQVADLLLSYEFFERELFDGKSDVMPMSLALADTLVRELFSAGAEELSFREQYLFAAVLAQYAGDIAPYHKAESAEALQLSEKVFRMAEKSFEAAQKDQGAETVQEQRTAAAYYAAAQLYKTAGKKSYRRLAEELAKEAPAGFSMDSPGYLGSIAYLTTGYKTDRALSELLMTSLLNDAIAAAEKDGDRLLHCDRDGISEDDLGEALEDARLFVFANSVSQSTLYVNAAEDAMGFLCGMNASGTDYSSENRLPVFYILNGLIYSCAAEGK